MTTIADIVSGRAPEVDFAFIGAPARKPPTAQTLARA
jgi:hypothetical protein